GDEGFYYVKYQTMALLVRATTGPGGGFEHAIGVDQRVVLRDDPTQVIELIPASPTLPLQVATDELPTVLRSRLPTLYGKAFVLPLINDFGPAPASTYDGTFRYDIHVFSGNSTGTTLRSAVPFTYSD